jgi:hypothetical protein
VTSPKDYWLYGLRVRSEMDLPELPLALSAGDADISVSLGAIPDHGEGTEMQITAHGALLNVPGTACYSIKCGTTIVVEPATEARARNVRLFLLGSAMGMLIHQRGLLPLHANTIMVGDRAIIFMGNSGAGKSTMAAWLHDLGHLVLGDDVCVVRDDGGHPTVSAGLPRLRLWKNSLKATGRNHSAYPLSYTGHEGLDKYDVALDRELPAQREVELAAIYHLAKGGRTKIRRLCGMNAAEAVIANTYRGQYVGMVGNARGHWEACVRLVRQTPVYHLERPWDLAAGLNIAKQIVDHAVSLPSDRS